LAAAFSKQRNSAHHIKVSAIRQYGQPWRASATVSFSFRGTFPLPRGYWPILTPVAWFEIDSGRI